MINQLVQVFNLFFLSPGIFLNLPEIIRISQFDLLLRTAKKYAILMYERTHAHTHSLIYMYVCTMLACHALISHCRGLLRLALPCLMLRAAASCVVCLS